MSYNNKSSFLAILSTTLVLGFANKADAVSFNITYDPSLSAFGAQETQLKAATQYVANEYSTLFTNDVTLNILVKADTSPGALGASLFEYDGNSYTYNTIRNALIDNASTPASISATNSLPVVDPTGSNSFAVPNAQAKALGLISGSAIGLDGTFFIGTTNSYTFDSNKRALPGLFDYLAVAEHEFSELMGRTTQLTNPGFGKLPFDLFRFTAPQVRNVDPNISGVYFSTDNGTTIAKKYNNPGGGDIQDWLNESTPDSYDAFLSPGLAGIISPVDVTVMNTLGWKSTIPTTPTVPVPVPNALLGVIGAGGAIVTRSIKKRTKVKV